MKDHTGDVSWMQLRSGQRFWALDPDPEAVKLEDIAHALSNQCRFGGHVSEFYSVAQHCCLVSRLIDGSSFDKLRGLLHDATEAYLVDLPRPIKLELPRYSAAEDELMKAIEIAFGIQGIVNEAVKRADVMALWLEAVHLMRPLHPDWFTSAVQQSDVYQEAMQKVGLWQDPLSPEEARREYLHLFHRYHQDAGFEEPTEKLLRNLGLPCEWCGRITQDHCDFDVPDQVSSHLCNKRVCRRCARQVDPDLAYCPDHAAQVPRAKAIPKTR